MASYNLRLGKPSLIFLPPLYTDAITEHPSTQAQVSQVIVKSRKVTTRAIDLFYRFEKDITAAIESLLLAHIMSPLPENLTLEGKGFTLHGNRVPWKYGKRNVWFSWGDQDLHASEDKWVFTLDIAPSPGIHSASAAD